MTTRCLAWDRWTFDFDQRPHIMAVLNITPDSFSDGGEHFDENEAVAHGFSLALAGADVLDIGGESTRPGAQEVNEAEEIRRVAPVIRALADRVRIPISIDTYKASVAKAAIDAGARIINDISAGRFDPDILGVAAEADVPLILMHMKGQPRTMQQNPEYADVVAEVRDFLAEAAARAEAAGVRPEKIVLDPGIGFGKTFDHNLILINRLRALTALGYPILVGASRKAFLGHILGGTPPKGRETASAAAAALAAYNGADILRVHDVRRTWEALAVAHAVKREHA
jgi:dihydropteroate synthase